MVTRTARRFGCAVALCAGAVTLAVAPAGAAVAPSATWTGGGPVVVTNTGSVGISGAWVSRTRRVDNAPPEDCPSPAGWTASLRTRIRWGTQTATLGPLVVQTCVYRAISDGAAIAPSASLAFDFGGAERVRVSSPKLGHLVLATPVSPA